MTNVRPITGGASWTIPATDMAPAIRAYACGCSYRADGGWSHCHSHTTVKGTLATASKVSRAAARDVARRARAARSLPEVGVASRPTTTVDSETLAIFEQSWRAAMARDGET